MVSTFQLTVRTSRFVLISWLVAALTDLLVLRSALATLRFAINARYAWAFIARETQDAGNQQW